MVLNETAVSIEMESFESGIYLLRMENQEGMEYPAKKLLKF